MRGWLAGFYNRAVMPAAVRVEVWALREQARAARRAAESFRGAGCIGGDMRAAEEDDLADAFDREADKAAAWLAGRATG